MSTRSRWNRPRARRGNVVVEFGLAFPLLLTFMSGMFQYGYGFFLYNQLQSVVRAGARYASTADFDSAGGGATFQSNVKNMVVYGTSSAGTTPLVRGLTTANVTVTWQADGAGIPQTITVNIANFIINAVWGSITLSDKPRATYIYLGQFLS